MKSKTTIILALFLAIGFAFASPSLDYTPPTLSDNSHTFNDWTEINLTINEENLSQFEFDWDYTEMDNYLVGYWRFDESLGTNAYDSSEIGNNGTLINMNPGLDNCTGNCSGWTINGKKQNAVVFDSVDDFVSVADDNTLDITDEITIEAWVNSLGNAPIPINGWQYMKPITLSPVTPEANYQVKIELTTSNFDYSRAKANGEDLRFYETNGTKLDYWIEKWNATGTSTIWVEVATNNTGTIYMYYGNPSASSESDVNSTFIRVIDGAQPLVGSWHFDEGSGTVAYDTSGNDNGGTLTNMDSATDWVNGKFGKALTFDGTDDAVNCGTDASLTGINSEISLEAWIYLDSLTTHNKVIYHSNNCYGIAVLSDGRTEVRIRDGGTNYDANAPAGTITAGQWYHLVGTYNGEYVRSYVNNVMKNEKIHTGDIDTSATVIYISNPSAYPFHGIIDEARIYNKALTVDEISDLYTNYGYTTKNYPGRVLVRKYASPEPTATIGNETATGISKAGSYGIGANTTTAFASINNQIITGAISSGWNHIVQTYNGSNQKLYANGELKTSQALTGAISANSNNFTIGNLFNGTIDEVRIYNTSLTANQVKQRYLSTRAKYYDNSLVLALNFNNNSAIGENSTKAVDISKYGNNGTFVNTQNVSYTSSGKFGTGVNFTGANGYIDCGNDSSLNITDEITISGWMKPTASNWNYKRQITLNPITSQPNYQVKVELTASDFDYSHANANGDDLRFYETNRTELDYWIEEWNTSGTSTIWVEVATNNTGTIYMYYGNSGAGAESNGTNTFEFFDDFESYPPGNWGVGTHGKWQIDKIDSCTGIKIESEDSQKTLNIYATGGCGSGSVDVFMHAIGLNLSSDLYYFDMGASSENGGCCQGNGLEVSSSAETDSLWSDYSYRLYETYNNNQNLYKRSGGSDTTLSSNSSKSMFQNKMMRLIINEANTLIKVSISTDNGETWTDILSNNSFTPLNQPGTIKLGQHGSKTNAWNFRFREIRVRKYASPEPTATIGNETAAGISKAGSYGIGANTTTAFASINNQTITGAIIMGWNHIVQTYDGSTQKLYANGELKTSQALTGAISANTNNLIIGDYFNGAIDEVRIYNRSMTADEIYRHYQSEFQKYNSTQYRFYNNISNLTNGGYTYYGWANDTAGSTNQTVTRTITIDTTNPSIHTLTSNDSLVTSGTIINVTATAIDANIYYVEAGNATKFNMTQSGNVWYIDNKHASDYGCIEGNCLLRATAYDLAGNSNTTTYILTVDDTAPALNWKNPTPADNSYRTQNYTELNLTIDDLHFDSFEFRWHNGTNWTNSSFYDDSLVMSMNFNNNENIGETTAKAVDISKYGNNGTFKGSALKFDGVDDYVDCGNDESLNITDAITIEAWVKIDKFQWVNSIVEKGHQGDNVIYWLNRGDDESRHCWTFNFGNGTTRDIIYAHETISLGVWYHAVATFNQGNAKLYINGNKKTEKTSDVTTINSAGYNVLVGAYRSDSPAHFFNGTIDNVRIYNRSLNATEIAEHYNGIYNNETGLVLHIPFSDKFGGTAEDKSGQGNNGTLTNFGDLQAKAGDDGDSGWTTSTKPLWINQGKFNGGVMFDGETDYIDCGNDESLQHTNAGTVEFWVYPVYHVVDEEGLVVKAEDNNWFRQSWRFSWQNPNYIDWAVSDNTENYKSMTLINPVSTNQWYHIAGIWDNGIMRGYVNGNYVGQNTFSFTVGTDFNVRIGSFTNAFFNGSIDAVRIYNRSLTANEIKLHYQSELSKYNSTQYRFYSNLSVNNHTHTFNFRANDTVSWNTQTERTVHTNTISITSPNFTDFAGHKFNISANATHAGGVDKFTNCYIYCSNCNWNSKKGNLNKAASPATCTLLINESDMTLGNTADFNISFWDSYLFGSRFSDTQQYSLPNYAPQNQSFIITNCSSGHCFTVFANATDADGASDIISCAIKYYNPTSPPEPEWYTLLGSSLNCDANSCNCTGTISNSTENLDNDIQHNIEVYVEFSDGSDTTPTQRKNNTLINHAPTIENLTATDCTDEHSFNISAQMSDPDSDTLTCKFYLDNAECHCTATGTVTGNYCNYSKVNNNTCECFAVGDTINIIAEASDEWHSKNSTSINNVIPNRAPTAPANLKLLINDAFNDTDHVITHNPLINWTNPLDDDGDALTIHAQVKEEGQSWQDDNSMNIQPADYSNEGMMTIGNSTLQDGKNYTFRLRACDAYSNCSGYAESNIWLRLNSNASINSDCTEPSPPFGNINLTVNITDPESDNIVWANFTVTKSKGTITSQNATTLNINNNSANHTLNLTYPSQTGNANLTIFYQNQKTHKLNSTQKSFNNETNATHHIQISSLINNATINITFSNLSNAENMTIYINSNQIDKIPNPQNITYNYSAALHPSQFNNFTYSLKNGTGTLDKTEITYYPNQSAELRINNNILGTIAFTNQTANSTFTNASQSWLANSTNITYTTGANITIFNCTINYSQTIPVTNNQNATQYGDLWKINFSTSADTTYSWSLVASDGFETSSLSNSFVTGNQNPLADGPFYSNIQNKHAFLAWSNATDADGTIISCKIHYGSNSEELLAQQNNTVNCSKEINTSHYSVNTEVAVYFVFKDDKQATKTTGIIYPIIPNQNPIITSLTLNNPHTYIDLITNWTFYDPEGDDTTQSIINWSRYGASYEVDQKNEYNLVSSNLEYTKTAKADNWSVCVKVKDQHNADSYINCTSNITIKNYPPQLTQIQNTTQAGHIIFISAIATDRDNETDFANCTIHYYNQHNASNKTGNLSTSYAGEQDPNQVKAKCAGNVTAGSWLFPNQNINITMQICDGNIPGGSNCTNTTMQTLMPNQMPQAILTTPPNRTNSTNSTIAFEWTSSDADKDNLTYNLTVYNSTGIFNCTDTTAQAQAITITSDGIYHWNVSATDLYNNTELNTTYSQARTITIDSTPPQLISAVCNITNISYNNAQNRTLNATQGDNITCTLEWSDNSQNWGIEGLANAALNITYSVKNNETENLNFTNNKTTFNLTNIPAGIIIFNTTAFDWLSNTNHSIINISANDTEAPAINTIYTSPSALADLDPNTTVTIYANITDNLAIHTALLYYHRNDSINTTNQTCVQMNKTNNIYNATLSNHQSGNWTYYIIANDTTGNTAQSQNYALQVWKDYTINVSINDVPANSIELNQNFTLGTITFNNTGDFNYTCDLSSSITSSKPMQFYYSSNSIELNPSDTSTRQINATGKEQGPLPNCKVNIQLPIDCTCLACTQSGADYINQIILYPEVEIRAAGPYFEDEITAPSSMQAGTSSTMHVKIRNIGTVNAENFSISFENMSSGISITGEATKSNPMLVQAGYPESFWRSFTISADADIYTDTYSFNIIANCTNCNSAQDIETVDIPIEGKTRTVIEKHYSGSSSGGSSSSYTSLIAPETITEEQKQKLFRTEATYELIRGGKQQFNLEVENPFEGDLLNVSVSITGFLSKYISVHPVFADRIHSGSSSNFTIFLEAPEYFKRGEYKLIFTIKGIINKTDEEINMKETRTITLIVLEISKQEAGHYIDQIKTIIEEMEDKNLNTKHLREFMETANASIRDRNYEKARDAYETIKKTSEHAFACVDTLNEMKKKQNEAIFNGIDIPKTKRLLLLAEAALNRGDYETAFKRAEDAKVTYALETVGVFNPFAFAVNNWQKLIAAFAAIMAMSYIGLLLLRCDFLNRKLKSLKKEENILLGLIRESQRECFEEGKMNMREYMQTLDQYEKQMSKAVQEIIKYETRRINLFKFFKKKSLILEEEKARLLDIIKDAQKIYLSAGNLDTRIYENRIKSYSERLVEVEEQLAAIKANDAMKKSSRILPVLLILLILPLPAFAVSDNSVHSAFILAEEGMDQMLEKGLPVTRYNDTLFLAKQIYEAQVALEEAGGSPDYSIAYSKLTELSQIKQKAFLALDELNALEATISQIEGIDKKPVREIHSKAKIEFEAERYEECLKSIDEAYEKISELEAIETKVKAFYEAGSRNIMGFLDKNRVQIVLFFSIMFLIIAVSYKRIVCWRIRNKMKALNARWYSIRALVAQTQREYFEDGKISETTYHIRIKKYGEMMRDIKRQIPLLNEELAIRMKKR